MWNNPLLSGRSTVSIRVDIGPPLFPINGRFVNRAASNGQPMGSAGAGNRRAGADSCPNAPGPGSSPSCGHARDCGASGVARVQYADCLRHLTGDLGPSATSADAHSTGRNKKLWALGLAVGAPAQVDLLATGLVPTGMSLSTPGNHGCGKYRGQLQTDWLVDGYLSKVL